MADPIPAGSEGIIPHLVVQGAAGAIEFYKQAFDAEEICRNPAPDGQRLMHVEVSINGARVYLCDDFPEMCGGRSRNPMALGASPVTIHQYVADVDAAIAKAQAAGAAVTMPPQDMFWGDRYGTVQDPFGHAWSFATHVRDVSPEEIAAAAASAFEG